MIDKVQTLSPSLLVNNWAFPGCPLHAQSRHPKPEITIFPVFCCLCPNLSEMCCWHQIQNKHIFTKNNEVNEVKCYNAVFVLFSVEYMSKIIFVVCFTVSPLSCVKAVLDKLPWKYRYRYPRRPGMDLNSFSDCLTLDSVPSSGLNLSMDQYHIMAVYGHAKRAEHGVTSQVQGQYYYLFYVLLKLFLRVWHHPDVRSTQCAGTGGKNTKAASKCPDFPLLHSWTFSRTRLHSLEVPRAVHTHIEGTSLDCNTHNALWHGRDV